MLLEKIQGPEDVRELDFDQLDQLAQEIRQFLIEKIRPPIWGWWS